MASFRQVAGPLDYIKEMRHYKNRGLDTNEAVFSMREAKGLKYKKLNCHTTNRD